MERNIKIKPIHLCMTIFMLCLSERFAIGKRFLYRFVWVGISNFNSAGQFSTFGNIYQQFFFDGLSNKNYGFRVPSAMYIV